MEWETMLTETLREGTLQKGTLMGTVSWLMHWASWEECWLGPGRVPGCLADRRGLAQLLVSQTWGLRLGLGVRCQKARMPVNAHC